MDDFSKQKVNEERYKKTKEVPPEEYTGDFESPHYIEKQNTTIKQTKIVEKNVFSTDYKEDFDKAAKDFWQKNISKGLSKYNSGSMTANFGKEKYTLEELLNRIGNFIKESISNELIEKGIPITDLSENFKAIDSTLKLLSKSIETLDKDIDITNIAGYMHGFINTYVSNVIKKKIERDKGKKHG